MEQELGVYELGLFKVKVFMRNGRGGNFKCIDENADCPTIRIGMDQEYRQVFLDMCHEAFEVASTMLSARYMQTNDVSGDNGIFIFVMDHTLFSNISAYAADFIYNLGDDLRKAYKEWHSKKK